MKVFKSQVQNQVIFLLSISVTLLFSCKAYRNPNNLKPSYPIESPELADKMPGLQNLLIGDEIKVVGKDQSIRLLKYCRVDSDLVLGEMWKDRGKKLAEPKKVQIPLAEIDFINVKRKSPAATVALIAGVGGGVALGTIIIVLSTLINHVGPDGN